MPFAFLTIIVIAIGLLYISRNTQPQACKGDYTFTDKSNNITLDYDCSWKLEIENQLSENFELNSKENLRRKFAKNYSINLVRENSEIKFEAVMVDIDSDIETVNPNSFIKFENDLVRVSDGESGEYFYGTYLKCKNEDQEEYSDCIERIIKLGNQNFRIEANVKDELLEEVDEIVFTLIN